MSDRDIWARGDQEDCGAFCVWWYRVPRQRPTVEWAYAWRSACGTYWDTSTAVTGFASRKEAEESATEARRLMGGEP